MSTKHRNSKARTMILDVKERAPSGRPSFASKNQVAKGFAFGLNGGFSRDGTTAMKADLGGFGNYYSNSDSSSSGGRDGKLISAPATTGYIRGSNTFRVGGRPQAIADFGGKGFSDGIRVTGSDNLAAITTGNTGNGGWNDGNNNGQQWADLQPIDPTFSGQRLSQFAELYEFYAYREITFRYVPTCSSGTSGGITFGVTEVADPNGALATATREQLLEFSVSSSGPVWQAQILRYKFSGTKVYYVDFGSTVATDNHQLSLGATMTAAAQSTTFGDVYIDYVIDFYKIAPPAINSQFFAKLLRRSRFEQKESLRKQSCQAYQDRLQSESARLDSIIESLAAPTQPSVLVTEEPDWEKLRPSPLQRTLSTAVATPAVPTKR